MPHFQKKPHFQKMTHFQKLLVGNIRLDVIKKISSYHEYRYQRCRQQASLDLHTEREPIPARLSSELANNFLKSEQKLFLNKSTKCQRPKKGRQKIYTERESIPARLSSELENDFFRVSKKCSKLFEKNVNE